MTRRRNTWRRDDRFHAVRRLPPVQQHYWILENLKAGSSQEELAASLGVRKTVIQRRVRLLDGVAPEVLDYFKEKAVNPTTFEILRRMKPSRQMTAAKMMVLSGNLTSSYAKSLLAATKADDLTKPHILRDVAGLGHTTMKKMAAQFDAIDGRFETAVKSHGSTILALTIAQSYIAKLLNNPRIADYLSRKHPEILRTFRSVCRKCYEPIF